MSLTKIRYTTELRVTCAPDRATGRSHRCQLSIRTAGLRFEALSSFEIKLRHFKTMGTTRDVLTSQDVWSFLWTRNTVAFSNRVLDSFGICPLVNPVKFSTFWFWLLLELCQHGRRLSDAYRELHRRLHGGRCPRRNTGERWWKAIPSQRFFPWESTYMFFFMFFVFFSPETERMWPGFCR